MLSAIGLRGYWSIKRTPPDLLERVQNAFVTATHSDPDNTPGLVSLRRATGLRMLLPNDHAQYDYRLLYGRNVVFLIGINSFLGIPYSLLFRFIVPSRTFHIEVLGDSWNGRRNKVNLTVDNEPLLEPLEITPEMLVKAPQQPSRSAVGDFFWPSFANVRQVPRQQLLRGRQRMQQRDGRGGKRSAGATRQTIRTASR